MHEDELIFLGSAILALRFGREPDETEIRTVVTSARKLYDEVRKQREAAPAKLMKLGLVDALNEQTKKP